MFCKFVVLLQISILNCYFIDINCNCHLKAPSTYAVLWAFGSIHEAYGNRMLRTCLSHVPYSMYYTPMGDLPLYVALTIGCYYGSAKFKIVKYLRNRSAYRFHDFLPPRKFPLYGIGLCCLYHASDSNLSAVELTHCVYYVRTCSIL